MKSRLLLATLTLVAQHLLVSPATAAEVVPLKTKHYSVKHRKTLTHKAIFPREIARRASRSRDLRQWHCLDKLWTHESHFNPKALNRSSGAYGIAQFMPHTWGNYKVKKTSNAALQIKYGIHYIDKRYGSHCAAWEHWKRYGWY
jgi:hypothetical protein